jgi:hypothetical protein
VFEESEAMMLTLHGNNLKAYLDNLESTSWHVILINI